MKDFDALVTLALGNETCEVALEYERTAKSSKQYMRIVEALRGETRIRNILYLAPTTELVSFLLYCFRSATQRVWASPARPFSENPLAALLFEVNSAQPRTLEDLVSA